MMDEARHRIEARLAAHAPAILAGLNPPATGRQFAETEEFLGMQLPDAVRAAYLRHDGQSPDSHWMLEGWEWLPLKSVREFWAMWKGKLDRGAFAGVHMDQTGHGTRRKTADRWEGFGR